MNHARSDLAGALPNTPDAKTHDSNAPDSNAHDSNALDTRFLMRTSARPELVMARGEGSWLWDEAGKAYLDFVQGWAVNCLGHCPPTIVAALSLQAAQLLNASPGLHTRPPHALAERLAKASGLSRAFFNTTGAEANEGAIKLARKWGQVKRGGAFEIITTHGSFHGRTLATMAASGKPGFDAIFPPRVPGFVKVPYGEVQAVADAIGKDTVAVMVEPIQGEGGVVVPEDGYLRALRSLTEERGLLLILDEVQTGMGRTGALFACQHEGVVPDLMTLGKGLGAGVPLSALLAREEACCFAPGDQGGTFAGHPLLTSVGLAVCDELMRPGFLEHVRAMGEKLGAALTLRSSRYGGFARGRGLLWAMSLPKPEGAAVVERALAHGLLVNSPRPELLRFMPALNVSEREIEDMFERLDAALEDVFGRHDPR